MCKETAFSIAQSIGKFHAAAQKLEKMFTAQITFISDGITSGWKVFKNYNKTVRGRVGGEAAPRDEAARWIHQLLQVNMVI